MRHKFIVSLGTALALWSAACGRQNSSPSGKAQSDQELHWLTDFEAAKTQARVQNKTLLINFTGSDWCPPCIMLDRQVFSQPEFADYAAKNLVLLEVDFPHNKAQTDGQKAANDKLADRYGIYGYPTEIVLDANGKKIGELGYTPGGPKAFIASLEKLRRADGTSIPPP